jgi:iron complex outermembrane receptor protein
METEDLLEAVAPSLMIRWSSGGPGSARNDLTWRAQVRRETAERTDHLNPQPDRGRAERLGWDLSLEDALHLAGGRLVLAPSLRWSRFESDFEADATVPSPAAATDEDTNLSGKAGAAWYVTERLVVRANAGRFYRVPSFTEIFGDQGSVKGNGDLVPEEGTNVDVGLAWQARRRGALDRLQVEAALFRSDAEDLIQFVQNSQSQVVAVNTGAARIFGGEIASGIGLWGWLRGSLAYTYQHAEDRSDTFSRGSDLPGRPRHVLSAHAEAVRPWGTPFYDFDYVGRNYYDAAAAALEGSGIDRDLIRVPGRFLHGVGYTRSLGKRHEMTVEIDNVFDVKTVDIARYPLPGRLVQARLRVSLP